MRILWVKANKLLPVHSGGDIRSYNILRQLSINHEVTLLSYYDGNVDREYERDIQQHLPGAVPICTGKKELSGLERGIDYFRSVPLPAPYAVSRFSCASVLETIERWFEQKSCDIAVCDFLDAAVNFPAHLGVPSVLFQHNVESEIWRRHAATESNPAKKLMYWGEFQKMLRYERQMVRKFHHVIAVSQHDRELMSGERDESRITVIPTGVDLQHYKADDSHPSVEPLVVFIGAMDWEPNIDGVEYFCNQVWPSVLADYPTARFRIVGRNPDRRVLKLASENVEVTGRVASVLDHLREAAVVVVPLRIGGGTRLKIYEAMACGKAVVSTTVGAEGLDVQHGRDITLVDEPKAFAQAVLMLLQDRELRCRYEKAAAIQVARYSWQAIGEQFGELLQKVAGLGEVELTSAASANARRVS